ncbi:single-stranded DNA-binding protein [Cumulibacter manganitolerans]|uniref:single-stranded DNA-binding protein n=1 Tax=Cumulibacter manganitolerans TaxID=1884992 RepID=UPI001295B26F|nr:single-stranded DNA-binding protein [Cumulibacter manganitolerans]
MSTSEGSPVNEVRLRGRLSGTPEVRTLPSGDQVAVWRLVVPRSADGGAVDTIDCEGYSRAVIRLAGGWPENVQLEVDGALRRRFWQTPGGARSRYVVDVRAARRVRTTKERDDPRPAVRAL